MDPCPTSACALRSRAARSDDPSSLAELVIHPDARDIERDLCIIALLGHRKGERLAAEIEMQILSARAPVRGKTPFDAGSRGPADPDRGRGFSNAGAAAVIRTTRPKSACRTCETVVQAPAPGWLIAGGIATPTLLAQVRVSK